MRKYSLRALTVTLAILLTFSFFSLSAYAQSNSAFPTGEYYEFTDKEEYSFDENANGKTITKSNAIGTLSINGDMKDAGSDAFYVQQGNVTVSYSVKPTVLAAEGSSWHLSEDKGKMVNGEKLDDSIGSGVIIVQSSLDGKEWLIDKIITDAFSGEVDLSTPFFTTKDLHQLNGCFYRVIIAYKMEKQVDSSKVLLWEKENYE